MWVTIEISIVRRYPGPYSEQQKNTPVPLRCSHFSQRNNKLHLAEQWLTDGMIAGYKICHDMKNGLIRRNLRSVPYRIQIARFISFQPLRRQWIYLLWHRVRLADDYYAKSLSSEISFRYHYSGVVNFHCGTRTLWSVRSWFIKIDFCILLFVFWVWFELPSI